MNLRSEISQLATRHKEVFVGLADGTTVRGTFGSAVAPNDDVVTFAVNDVTGPGKGLLRAGVLLAIAQICWIETA